MIDKETYIENLKKSLAEMYINSLVDTMLKYQGINNLDNFEQIEKGLKSFLLVKSIKLTSTLETLEAIKSDKNLVFLPQNEIPIINNNQEGSLN